MPNLSTSRQLLCRFSLNFFLINILLSLLVSINYLHVLPDFFALADSKQDGVFLWIFFAISFFAQISIMFLLCFLFTIIFILIIPHRNSIFSLAIVLGAALLFCLIGDSIAFNLFHMHYAMVGWEIFKANAISEVISFSIFEQLGITILSLILLLIECIIAWRVWRHVSKDRNGRWSYGLAVFSIFCIITSYSLNFLDRDLPGKNNLNANNKNLIVKATRFVPYYDDFYQFIIPINATTRYIQTPSGRIDVQLQTSNRLLNYPKHDLQFQKTSQPLNIVFIVVDTWRYDAMNPVVTPHIYAFSKKTLQFNNHWSGGNSTKAGLFSLFYGLPANYWDAFLKENRGPELTHQLIKANYSMNIFSSASLNFPAFDKTVFSEIKPLMIRTEGDNTLARDEKITQEFTQFLETRKADRPFFSFLFYDAAHNYCESTLPNQRPFSPSIKDCNRFFLTKNADPLPYVNRYLNSVHFVDGQIKQVLHALESRKLLKNTIIIITADHGEEINDNHSGYWQHASAYTSQQLHIPLLVYWPNQKPKIYTHYTTHYDISPTLMTRVLHCKNPLKDYTLGQSLFSNGNRPVLISGSYADYAVITQNQVTRIYNGGDYVLDNSIGSPIDGGQLQIKPMRQALEYLNEYFKPA